MEQILTQSDQRIYSNEPEDDDSWTIVSEKEIDDLMASRMKPRTVQELDELFPSEDDSPDDSDEQPTQTRTAGSKPSADPTLRLKHAVQSLQGFLGQMSSFEGVDVDGEGLGESDL